MIWGMISQTAEYALRVHRSTGEPAGKTGDDPADRPGDARAGGISRQGLAITSRGVRSLAARAAWRIGIAREPGGISIFDVIDAVDPIQRIRSCPLQLRSHGTALCPLHRRLDQAMRRWNRR